jgi:hypothetical protein
MRNTAVAIVAFLGMLLAVSQGIRRTVPTHAVILSEKMEYLTAHGDDYSILLLGSSHVYRHLIPPLLDREIQRATGTSVRSFNLGAPGLALPEAFVLLDRFFAATRGHLDWVVVDTTLFSETTPENLLTRRDLDWHDWEETLLACKYLVASRQPSSEKLDKVAAHWRALLMNYLGSGRVAEHARYHMDTDRLLDNSDLFYTLEDEGYRSLDSETDPTYLERAQSFRAKVREGVTFKGHNKHGKYAAEAYRAHVFARIVGLADSHGARVAFFDPPRITAQPRTFDVEGVPSPLVFDFQDAQRFPSLYDMSLWFDQSHLNRRGSDELTALLAREFAASVGDARAVR